METTLAASLILNLLSAVSGRLRDLVPPSRLDGEEDYRKNVLVAKKCVFIS